MERKEKTKIIFVSEGRSFTYRHAQSAINQSIAREKISKIVNKELRLFALINFLMLILIFILS